METAPSAEDVTPVQLNQISKNQLKKQIKRQKWLELRPERRRLEREKRKQKRQLQAQEKAKEEDGSGEQVRDEKPLSSKIRLMSESSNRFRIVIDLDFDEFMTDSELSKSVQQVGRIYAANRHSPSPCQLYVTSLTGRVRDKFMKTNTGCENWDINLSQLSYEELIRESDGETAKTKLIYLSGDSDNVLPEVDEILKEESKVFVIGGLVDHNRHKNLCQTRAEQRGVYTARLPIKEHIKLNQRHILSTVTVFEILLRISGQKQSWKEALAGSIPKRKQASDGDE